MPHPVRLIATQPFPRRAQMSQPKRFAPQRALGRRLPREALPELSREAFLSWWSGLMLRTLGSAHAVARKFDVTEQTGRNWIEGFSCPTGVQVMRAREWWPAEFDRAASRMGRAA